MNEPKSAILRYGLPRIQDVLFAALFLAVIGLGSRLINVDGDLGRHLTIGNTIWENGRVPIQDIYSHTMPGEPLVPHEWLSQVIFAFAYRLGRIDAVIFLCALIVAATFTLVFRECQRRSELPLVALSWTILAAAASSLHWLARPHLFTLFFTAVWLILLERTRRGAWKRIYQPFLIMPVWMWLWANLHGAFLVGFVLWGIFLIGMLVDRWLDLRLPSTQHPNMLSKAEEAVGNGQENLTRQVPGIFSREILQLSGVGIIAFVATFINPAGKGLWATSVGYLGNRYLVNHTAEYLSPDFHQISTWPFLLMVAASLVILGLKNRRLPVVETLHLGCWTAMALYSTRNIPLYAIILSPILSEITAGILSDYPILQGFKQLNVRLLGVDRLLRGGVIPVALVLVVALGFRSGTRLDFDQTGNQFDPRVFPVAAVNWLSANPPPGKAFNYFTWGGYLLFRLWPDEKVFIDGQTDFYGEELTRQYEQVITLAPGWKRVLDDYQVGWVLVPSDSRLAQTLQADVAWEKVYQDATAAILFRLP